MASNPHQSNPVELDHEKIFNVPEENPPAYPLSQLYHQLQESDSQQAITDGWFDRPEQVKEREYGTQLFYRHLSGEIDEECFAAYVAARREQDEKEGDEWYQKDLELRELQNNIRYHPYVVSKKMALAQTGFFSSFLPWLGFFVLTAMQGGNFHLVLPKEWAVAYWVFMWYPGLFSYMFATYGFLTMRAMESHWREKGYPKHPETQRHLPWWRGNAWIEAAKIAVMTGLFCAWADWVGFILLRPYLEEKI